MRFLDSRADQSDGAVPTSCPKCQSTSIATTAKRPVAESYWRCESCGEIWNNSRRRQETRTATRHWR
jgi:transposase-like protein